MTEDQPDPNRNQLAAELRSLRQDADLSTTQLAAILGWSQSKVSKTELGRTAPAVVDVAAWATATNATPTQRRALLECAEQLAHQAVRWRRELSTGRRKLQETIQRLEENATVIRVFSPDVIVGLAQTRAYAAAMFRLGRDGPSDEAQDEIINARLARQAVLHDERKRFSLLMSETALWRQLVAPQDMREQLTHLQAVARNLSVSLGVIPFAGPERLHQYHGFAILGDPDADTESRVLVETVTRALTVRAADEVREYVSYFDALTTAAAYGDELQELIVRRLTQLPT